MTQLSDILSYVRVRTNLDNSQAVTDPQLTTFVNYALASLDSLLANTYEDFNWAPGQSVIATAGSYPANSFPMPADCLRIRAVHFGQSGAWITLPSFPVIEYNRWANPVGQMLYPYGNNVARRYCVLGQTVAICPELAAMGQYRFFYTPKFQPLVDPSDSLPTYMDTQDWLEYAVAATGIKVYNRLNLPTDGFQAELAQYRDSVVAAAVNRNAGSPKGMSNTRNIADYTFPLMGGGWGGD